MIDSLDMHAVVGDGEGFRQATAMLLRDFDSGVLTFDRDVVVSVFEASIRVLGGLVRPTENFSIYSKQEGGPSLFCCFQCLKFTRAVCRTWKQFTVWWCGARQDNQHVVFAIYGAGSDRMLFVVGHTKKEV